MTTIADPAQQRWGPVITPILSALTGQITSGSLTAALGQVLARPAHLAELPAHLGPEITGALIVDEAGVLRLYTLPGPDWFRLLVVARHACDQLLRQPATVPTAANSSESPAQRHNVLTITGHDPDGEMGSILLVDELEERARRHAGSPAEPAPVVEQQLRLLTPVREQLADAAGRLARSPTPWPLELEATADDPPAVHAVRRRQRRQWLITGIYEAWLALTPLVPATLTELAKLHTTRAGLDGRAADAVTTQVCLQVALAAARAGAVPRSDVHAPPLPGSTPRAAAARLASHLTASHPDDVRRVLDAVTRHLDQPSIPSRRPG